MKYFTKILVLFAVFVTSIWYFGTNMRVETYSVQKSIDMGDSTFPSVSMLTDKNEEINMLSGYAGNVDSNNFRDAMMPLDTSNTVKILIRENETTVKKLNYDVIDIGTDEVLFSNSISALDTEKEGKAANLKITADLESGKEYSLKITLITEESKKISYFCRIKPTDTPHITEKLKFIMDFHNATFNAEAFNAYKSYLEVDSKKAGKSLLDVNINSSVADVTWVGMKPKVVSSIIPTIKEINADTISVQLKYLVKGTIKKTSSDGEEVLEDEKHSDVLAEEAVYVVTEFYRIRYTADRTYLLKWSRTMDANYDFTKFNPSNAITSKSNFISLGLTDSTNTQVVSTDNNKKLAFVDHGTLWYYDIENNTIISVLTYQDQIDKYYSSAYDSYNIKVLDINEAGDINFIVYGYISKGDYEGRVGMILYKYIASEERIEEQLYIPIERPYEVIESEMDGLYYLSDLNVFYFSINNSLYSYNINTRKLQTISDDVTSRSLVLSTRGQFVAWQESSNIRKNTKLNILNLETEQKYELTSKGKERIALLAMSDTYVIYGFVKEDDIATLADSSTVYPMKEINIVDSMGNILKKYRPNKGYITDVKVSDTSIDLTLMKKSSSEGYVPNGKDYIVNKIPTETSSIALSTVELAPGYKQVRVSLPTNFKDLLPEQKDQKKPDYTPSVKKTKSTMINEDTTVQVQTEDSNEVKYYAYASGELQKVYGKASDAILYADENMGVVVDSNNHIIWERGETDSSSSLSNMSQIKTGSGVDSTGACVAMLLKYNHISVDAKDVSKTNKSMYELIKENMDHAPVNLTGCKLSEVLYYVSHKKPVIAMRNKSDAVLITGYSESSVTYYDPRDGKSVTKGLTEVEKMFENAGNVFMSYTK
ncbi:MAG: hypothetical protein Q4G58_01755 [bacterium]|nr:hypothetical protein [bacterium]